MDHRRDLKATIKLIFWLIVGGFLMTPLLCRSCRQDTGWYLVVAVYCSLMSIVMWFGNESIVDWLDKKLSWTREPVKRVAAGVIAMLLYTVLAAFILMNIFRLFGYFPGTLSTTIYFNIIATSIITSLLTARSFLLNWRQAAIDAEKLQKEGMAAKYETLKSQVDPHFLFNSLNALTNLVYDDREKAVKFIKQLSEVYRYVLDSRDKEVVSVEEELSFLKAYLFLQQIRFGDKLKLSLSLDHQEGVIPPLVLQMLAENAIKHNVISEEHPLTIRVYRDGKFIVVENNLQEKESNSSESNGIGLENIIRRYKFLTDETVEVVRSDRFIVKLPLINNYATTDH